MAGSRDLKVGVLALQGAVAPHIEKLRQIKIEAIEIRQPKELEQVSAIILPGGESTTMLHLLKLNKLWDPLKRFVSEKPVLGVCAGAILLAKRVDSPAQESLDAIDLDVQRNAYGRQLESFVARLDPTENWKGAPPPEGVFIRAPKFVRLGSDVKRLLLHGDEVVMVEQGNVLAASFHSELTNSTCVHEYLASKL